MIHAIEQERVIGTVKGPGESANQYVFITSDSTLVKVGEYVYYNIEDG